MTEHTLHLVSEKFLPHATLSWIPAMGKYMTISTTSLPLWSGGYETCIFKGRNSEVVAEYKTEDEAILGHMRIIKKYGLTEVRVVV